MIATSVPDGMAGWWWLALAVGLVVAIVVVILLQLLYRNVKAIEHGADAIWMTGKQLARNTSTTWMLGQTGQALEQIRGALTGAPPDGRK